MPIRLAFAVTETGTEAAAGDYFTALELGAALQARFGWQIEYRPKVDGWYDLAGVDLLVVMVEEFELPAIRNASPKLITIAWARNWFERWCEHPWIGDYDMLLASSRRAADFMSQRTGKLARLLRIATNPARFNIEGRHARPTLDYVFTGHYWQAERDIVAALSALPTHYCGTIYGKHWEQVPALAHLHWGFVPYGRIHEVYQKAAIVIDDANHVTKEWGAANSRVFDALAAGCLVITNSRSVSDDVFDGRLPVYESPEGLANLLDRYLNDVDERTRLLNELRGMVLAQHCYTHRAMELGLHLRSLRKRGIDLTAATAGIAKHERTIGLSPAAPEKAIRTLPLASGKVSSKYPLVSVVMPSLNQGQFINAAIDSVLNQDYQHLELIVADGVSTDETVRLLSERANADKRLRWYSEPDTGPADALNKALGRARGTIIGWLNADDLYAPGAIRRVIDTFERNPTWLMAYGHGEHVDIDGRVTTRYPTLPPQTPILKFSEGCFICQPTVFFSRTMLVLLGKLDQSLKTAFDFDYWLRAFLGFPERIGFIDAVQAYSRFHDGCITLRSRRRVMLEGMWLISKHLGVSPRNWVVTYADELASSGMSDADRNVDMVSFLTESKQYLDQSDFQNLLSEFDTKELRDGHNYR